MCIVRDMMVVAQNNELEFQRLLEHHPFKKEGPCVEHHLAMHFFMKDDVNDGVLNETSKFLIPFNGVVNWDGVLK